jgi:peptidyl-prolyl cis-trans isomerase C
MRRRLLWILIGSVFLASGLAGAGAGCGGDPTPTPDPSRPTDPNAPRVHGLTPEEAAQPLAVIGDTTITVGQFAEDLASKGSFIRTRYNSPERRREYLDQMIRFELLAQEADRRGYDELPEVVRTRKQVMIRRFLEQRTQQGGPESISAEDVRAFYDANQSEYHTPEQVRASHIQTRDRATAQRVLQQLLAAPDDLRLYRQLAEQHNVDDETRDRFGDLRFFSRPSERTANEPVVPDAVAEAAFRIERIGGIHPEVVESDRGFHVVKLTGRRAAMHRTLEEAERSIRSRLWRQRNEEAVQRLIDELRAEADVQENLDLLGEVRLEIPEGDSPTVTHPQLEVGQGMSGAIRVPPGLVPGTAPQGTAPTQGSTPTQRTAPQGTAPRAPAQGTTPAPSRPTTGGAR